MMFFQKVNMASETVRSFMKTGLMQDSSDDPIAVGSGAFVKLIGLADSPTYSPYVAGMKDLNLFEMTMPVTADVTATNVGIYVTDPVTVSSGTIAGNVYREGAKTLGLGVEAGEPCSIRQLVMDDMFLLGADNFASSPTVGQYAILTNAAVTLTPNASKPASGFAVYIESEINVSQGLEPVEGYLCRVVQL